MVMLVGDASGHGMKAAMSIMTMHTLVRMIRAQQYKDTAAFVAEVNNQLCQQSVVNEEGGFITLLYVILRLDRHDIQWTSAGHPVPLMQSLLTGEVEQIGPEDAGGLPLGIMPDVEYETYTTPIPEHSRLLLYTDGLEEAFPEGRSGVHHQFGRDGVVRTLKETYKLPAKDALQALLDASSAFTEGSGRHDDTSLVVLDRL
ncbi:MAG TPA: serine/threonine-protein phosphatase [Planctomycetaceae bacterium]|nr:serine/threonine-protein phosphatase [Planctomycetaceae bacterium]